MLFSTSARALAAADGGGKASDASDRSVTPNANASAGAKTAMAVAERNFDAKMLASLLPYVWPADKPDHRARVVGALSLLVTSKLFNVGTPFLFKYAVDALAVGATGAATGPAALAAVPVQRLGLHMHDTYGRGSACGASACRSFFCSQ